MGQLKLEHWPTGRLTEYEHNPRKNDPAVDRMCAAIRDFGFRIPIVARSNGEVVDGHLRLKAARKLGLAQVPVALADDLTEGQIKAFRLLANKSAEWAKWDLEKLGLELAELPGLGIDLASVGFEPQELNKLLPTHSGMTDPDETPAPPATPASRPGDVWLLGRHRLLCGDSTKAEDVARVLGDVKPHLMVTDPPYGVEYDPSWRNDALRADGSAGADRATGQVMNDGNADWRAAWALFPGEVAYVWHAGLYAGVVADSLEASGFKLRSQIIWAKSNFAIGRGDYHWKHEPCWYAVREKAKNGHWSGDRTQTTVWDIAKPAKSETGHGTQKPVECMKRPIENNSSPGQAVYEPFNGSGTTIIAGEATGRAILAIELNPIYVDVTVRRWEMFAGKTATLENDGRDFAAVAAERVPKAA